MSLWWCLHTCLPCWWILILNLLTNENKANVISRCHRRYGNRKWLTRWHKWESEVRVIKEQALQTTHTYTHTLTWIFSVLCSCFVFGFFPHFPSALSVVLSQYHFHPVSCVFSTHTHSPTHKHSVGLKLHTVVGCITLWITAASCCYCSYTCVPHSSIHTQLQA